MEGFKLKLILYELVNTMDGIPFVLCGSTALYTYMIQNKLNPTWRPTDLDIAICNPLEQDDLLDWYDRCIKWRLFRYASHISEPKEQNKGYPFFVFTATFRTGETIDIILAYSTEMLLASVDLNILRLGYVLNTEKKNEMSLEETNEYNAQTCLNLVMRLFGVPKDVRKIIHQHVHFFDWTFAYAFETDTKWDPRSIMSPQEHPAILYPEKSKDAMHRLKKYHDRGFNIVLDPSWLYTVDRLKKNLERYNQLESLEREYQSKKQKIQLGMK